LIGEICKRTKGDGAQVTCVPQKTEVVKGGSCSKRGTFWGLGGLGLVVRAWQAGSFIRRRPSVNSSTVGKSGKGKGGDARGEK